MKAGIDSDGWLHHLNFNMYITYQAHAILQARLINEGITKDTSV